MAKICPLNESHRCVAVHKSILYPIDVFLQLARLDDGEALARLYRDAAETGFISDDVVAYLVMMSTCRFLKRSRGLHATSHDVSLLLNPS